MSRQDPPSTRKPFWHATPQRQHQKSHAVLPKSDHAPLHRLHGHHESPWPPQPSDCVRVCPKQHAQNFGHTVVNGLETPSAAGDGKPLPGAADAVPKNGPKTGPKSVPPSGSTNSWWNRCGVQILASIGGPFFCASKSAPQRGGHATDAQHGQPLNPFMSKPNSSVSLYGLDPSHVCDRPARP